MAVNIIQGLCYMWSLKILHRGKRLPAETKTAQSVQHKYSMFNTVCSTLMYSTNKQKIQQNHNIYSKIKTSSTTATNTISKVQMQHVQHNTNLSKQTEHLQHKQHLQQYHNLYSTNTTCTVKQWHTQSKQYNYIITNIITSYTKQLYTIHLHFKFKKTLGLQTSRNMLQNTQHNIQIHLNVGLNIW